MRIRETSENGLLALLNDIQAFLEWFQCWYEYEEDGHMIRA